MCGEALQIDSESSDDDFDITQESDDSLLSDDSDS